MSRSRILILRIRSLLKTAACYVEDSHSGGGLLMLISGRQPGCSYVVPWWRREPLWITVAGGGAGIVLPLFVGVGHHWLLPDQVWYAAAAVLAAWFVHAVLDVWVFDGHHIHCDVCDSCSLDVGGRSFTDRRNAIAFTISELGWCIGANRNFAYCPCTDGCTDGWPDDYPFRPATGTAGSEPV